MTKKKIEKLFFSITANKEFFVNEDFFRCHRLPTNELIDCSYSNNGTTQNTYCLYMRLCITENLYQFSLKELLQLGVLNKNEWQFKCNKAIYSKASLENLLRNIKIDKLLYE